LTVVSGTSAPPFQPLRHQGNVCHQGGFIEDQTDGSHWGPRPGSKADVQEVGTVFLEFSLGLLGLYCYDEAVPVLPVGPDIFCELHPKASTELHILTTFLKIG
jgi:hypothetical protein